MILTDRLVIGLIPLRVIPLLLAAPVLMAQQRPVPGPIPRGTSSISGHVIDSMSKEPVAGCTIRVGASGNFNPLVSGPDGAYELKGIAADNYYFFVQCPAHLVSCSGPDNYNCLLVEVVRDQERKGVNFQVVPGAIARGQVVSLDGRPIAKARVRLGRGMRGEPTASNTASTTDEKGRFELINLLPVNGVSKWKFHRCPEA